MRLIQRPGDVFVASVHWGGNWGYEIPREQKLFAHRLIDEAGIDVVHGHSAHHAKSIEVYAGRPVLYSCGDFLNDYEGTEGHEEFRGDLALMYFPTFDPSEGRLVRRHDAPPDSPFPAAARLERGCRVATEHARPGVRQAGSASRVEGGRSHEPRLARGGAVTANSSRVAREESVSKMQKADRRDYPPWGAARRRRTLIADASPTAIAARAEASASDLAGSVRSLEGTLSAVPALAAEGRPLAAAEHDALVEAGMKAQLAGLASELDLLSAAVASGADPAMQQVLLLSVTRRAAALRQLGARPAQVAIPADLQAELLTLWRDVQALSASLATASSPLANLGVESP